MSAQEKAWHQRGYHDGFYGRAKRRDAPNAYYAGYRAGELKRERGDAG